MTALAGILLSESVLHSAWFGVLTGFVAVNTVMYVALAIAKLLPPVHPSGWFRRDNARSETRHIDPDAPTGGP